MRIMAAGIASFVVLSGSVVALASATAPKFRATLKGQTRTPVAGKRWRFVLRAVDSAGRPVKGTAVVRVYAGSRRIDTVGWFGFKGVLRRTYRWPQDLQGSRAALRVKVVGPGGSRTVSYRVSVSSITGRPHFRATVTGQNHVPKAGVPWKFVVRAVDTTGKRFSGTAVMRVLVGGKVVDTIGWFGIKGLLKKTYSWSPTLKGSRAVLQARVIGPGGTRTAAYSVRVR